MTFTTGPPNGTVTAGRRRRLSRCVLALRKGETTFVTSSLPAASPGSISVAMGAEAADCRLGLAGAGRAAEASETVVASIRSGGRSSGAAAGTLAAVLLFRVAICWPTSVVTDLWWALLIYIYIYIFGTLYILVYECDVASLARCSSGRRSIPALARSLLQLYVYIYHVFIITLLWHYIYNMDTRNFLLWLRGISTAHDERSDG